MPCSAACLAPDPSPAAAKLSPAATGVTGLEAVNGYFNRQQREDPPFQGGGGRPQDLSGMHGQFRGALDSSRRAVLGCLVGGHAFAVGSQLGEFGVDLVDCCPHGVSRQPGSEVFDDPFGEVLLKAGDLAIQCFDRRRLDLTCGLA